MKYIDAEKLKAEIERLKEPYHPYLSDFENGCREGGNNVLDDILSIIDSLRQEQPMPDSTQLIAEWEKEKAELEQKDFRGDAVRMAYNAFLDGFIKGLGYESTK